MLKVLLAAAAFLLGSIPCSAYVQPGAPPDAQAEAQQTEPPSTLETEAQPHTQSPSADRVPTGRADRAAGRSPVEVPRDQASNPSQPVPEPSVVLLTSMGLLALGVAMRRRHTG